MKRLLLLLPASLVLLSWLTPPAPHAPVVVKSTPLTAYADPFIGTAGTGHTFPGACYPFGMVQLSPDTKTTGWEHCSGYHSDDSTIEGFSHTHLSGTGCGDGGDILLMPIAGGSYTHLQHPYPGSAFHHQDEKASPGYYSVLFRNGILAELSVSERIGFHHYHFPASTAPEVLLDLQHGINDEATRSHLQQINGYRLSGYRYSKGWAENEKIYFAIDFSVPVKIVSRTGEDIPGIYTNNWPDRYTGTWCRALLAPADSAVKDIYCRVALSSVSENNAILNLNADLHGFDLHAVKKDADAAWEENLGKIKVSGGAEADLKSFYTALYHCMIHPSLWNDANGDYRGMDDEIHHCAPGHNMYHIFSLWDTYRALHPLMTLIDPKRDNDFVRSLLAKYEESGKLPVWELYSQETNCMIGYHAIPVIVDAYMKGIRDFDTVLALQAMIHSAMQTDRNSDSYRTKGYIPSDKGNESVSKTLEYAYDDWCISTMARKMKADTIDSLFHLRAQYYENLWDPSTAFFRAKRMGKWVTPFNPYEVNSNYTEANAWQYLFAVQHDIGGLKNLMGGDAAFGAKLDSLFTTQSKLAGRDQPDISGMIGQYAQGNEPSHHFAYLYDYCGQPWKTARLTRQIMHDFYKTTRDGLCGNDDCGQMSAWYLFSAMGFYPVCPGSNEYAVGAPLFQEIQLQLGNGKVMDLNSDPQPADLPYVSQLTYYSNLTDDPLGTPARQLGCAISQQLLMQGGYLHFTRSAQPDPHWGTLAAARPHAELDPHNLTPLPYFEYSSNAFYDTLSLKILSPVPKPVHYIIRVPETASSGSVDVAGPLLYDRPISLHHNSTVAATNSNNNSQLWETADFYKIPFHAQVFYKNKYRPQYSAGGQLGLIDGVHGEETSFAAWQGFDGDDFEAVVRLDSVHTIHHIMSDWLADQNSWIFWPTKVTYEVSADSVHWTMTDDLNKPLQQNDTVSIWYDESNFTEGISLKYLRVHAVNIGTCPPWHRGAGEKSWVFVDEIELR